jgi:hypothetical protein
MTLSFGYGKALLRLPFALLAGSTAPDSPASKRMAKAFPGQFHFATFTLLYARVSTSPALLL